MRRITWLAVLAAVALLALSAAAFAQGGEGQQSITAAAVPGGLGMRPLVPNRAPQEYSSTATATPSVTQLPAPPASGESTIVAQDLSQMPPYQTGPVASAQASASTLAIPAGLPPNPTAMAITSTGIYVISNGYFLKYDKNLCLLERTPLPPSTTSVAVAGFRSQPVSGLPTSWEAHLAPLNAGGYSYASGIARLWLDPNGQTMHYSIDVQDLQNVTDIGVQYAMGQLPPLQAPAVAGLYGGPILTRNFTGRISEGTLTDADLSGWFASYRVADLADAINNGRVYIVVHTTQHPQGEIMGRLRPAGSE